MVPVEVAHLAVDVLALEQQQQAAAATTVSAPAPAVGQDVSTVMAPRSWKCCGFGGRRGSRGLRTRDSRRRGRSVAARGSRGRRSHRLPARPRRRRRESADHPRGASAVLARSPRARPPERRASAARGCGRCAGSRGPGWTPRPRRRECPRSTAPRCGVVCPALTASSTNCWSNSGVSAWAGLTQETATPVPAHSCARHSVHPTRPCLAALYSPSPALWIFPNSKALTVGAPELSSLTTRTSALASLADLMLNWFG